MPLESDRERMNLSISSSRSEKYNSVALLKTACNVESLGSSTLVGLGSGRTFSFLTWDHRSWLQVSPQLS